MAGGVTIQIDDREVKQALARLSHRLKDMTPIFRLIEPKMRANITTHFDEEKGPKGKWQALSPLTIAARREGKKKKLGTKILQDTGFLKTSFISKSARTSASVETDKIYAPIHNFGGMAGRGKKVHIPQREFMYLDPAAVSVIKQIVGESLKKEWNK